MKRFIILFTLALWTGALARVGQRISCEYSYYDWYFYKRQVTFWRSFESAACPRSVEVD